MMLTGVVPRLVPAQQGFIRRRAGGSDVAGASRTRLRRTRSPPSRLMR
jgi:hypothetical protein